MTKTHLLLAAAVTFLAGSASAQLTLPVTDNFPSSGPELSWLDYNGAYSNVEAFAPTAPDGDGYVMNVNDASYHSTIFLADDDGSLTDYKITAYIYVPVNTTVWSRVGVQIRCQSNDNFNVDGIYFIVDTDGDNYMRISRRDGGTYSVVSQLTATYTRDTWHKFELSAVGDVITAELDDVEVYSDSIASAFPTGRAALYNYINGNLVDGGSATLVDRVTIESLVQAQTDVESWTLYH